MICNPFDIVEVPFLFSDRKEVKKRKALILSTRKYNENNSASVMMMITSAQQSSWWGDVHLKDWLAAGLRKACIARAKFFTLDNALIIDKVGQLKPVDREAVHKALAETMGIM